MRPESQNDFADPVTGNTAGKSAGKSAWLRVPCSVMLKVQLRTLAPRRRAVAVQEGPELFLVSSGTRAWILSQRMASA